MVSRSILPTDVGITTEERLRCVTAVCVASMVHGGLDNESIRRRVLEIAREVIQALAGNVYQFETHTAIVQRAIDEVLSQLRPGTVEAVTRAGDALTANTTSLDRSS